MYDNTLIEIAENYLSDPGAEALVKAATENRKITALDICKSHNIKLSSP